MNQDLLTHVAVQSIRQKTPEIVAGMSVKVSQKIREGEKERVQSFEGLVIATSGGKGVAATFTVRKIVGGVGVEKVFPLHGKNIVKIEIIKKAKVRRSKLYYARGLRGKAARMSETHVNEIAHDEEADKKAAAALKKQQEEAAKAKEEKAAAQDENQPENAAKDPKKEAEDKPAEQEAGSAADTSEASEVKPTEEKPKEEAVKKTEEKSEPEDADAKKGPEA